MAVTTMKTPLLLPDKCTFEQYLTRPPAPNVEATVPLNFSSGFSGKAAETAAKDAQGQARQSAGAPPLPSPSRENSLRMGETLHSEASSSGVATSGGLGSKRSLLRRRVSGKGSTSNNGATSSLSGRSPFNVSATSSSKPNGAHVPGSSSKTLSRHSRGMARKSGAARTHIVESDTHVVRTRADGSGRKFRARIWLASKVPINQRSLLPLLEIMGTQNQYIAKVRIACNTNFEKPDCGAGTRDVSCAALQHAMLICQQPCLSL